MSEHAPLSLLPLFAVPDIQTPAPSVPSKASEDVADAVTKGPYRRQSYRRVLLALAAHGPMTREQLSDVTGYKEASLCARLSELTLEKDRDGNALHVECEEGVAKSRSGFMVNRYSITRACRDRITQPMRDRVRVGTTEDVRHG